MNDINAILNKLKNSSFRRSFRLKNNELSYLQQKGIDIILQHAADFIRTRLAPAKPDNDGKQTPYKGHPVFLWHNTRPLRVAEVVCKNGISCQKVEY